jgi:hypothetical protein
MGVVRRPVTVFTSAALAVITLVAAGTAVAARTLGHDDVGQSGIAALAPRNSDLDSEVDSLGDSQPGLIESVALPLRGCPPPPRPPVTGPSPEAWHPPVLVPEDELPAPAPAPAWTGDLAPLAGKGMWIWKYRQSQAGDPDAIVDRAVKAGLHQLWVRVGDSRDRFYGADVLAALVPRAHARGLAVIGWGFPFLWDPVDDARWSADVLAWRGPDGSGIDGFSPDIEMQSEGVALSSTRAQVYLGLTRRAGARTLLVATVYRPSDIVWGRYPYDAIAPYVDAFAPMVYWGCTEPGDAAIQTVERLAALRPVHLIGQAYDMTEDGAGRAGAPSATETRRFLSVALHEGAVGASFWVWQSMDDDQWTAMAGFGWPSGPRLKGVHD